MLPKFFLPDRRAAFGLLEHFASGCVVDIASLRGVVEVCVIVNMLIAVELDAPAESEPDSRLQGRRGLCIE